MRSILPAALIVFIASLLITGGHLYSPDDEVLFRVAQSIAFHGQLSIEPIEGDFASAVGRNGRHYAQYGIGQALLSVPLVWIGEGLAQLIGPAAREYVFTELTVLFAGNEPSQIMQRFAVSFFNAFVAAITAGVFAWFCYRITRSHRIAFITTLVYGLSTLALAHSRTYFTEPLATLCVFWSLALLHTGFDDRSARKLIFGGALAGFSVLVRVDSVVAWPALFMYAVWRAWALGPDEVTGARKIPMRLALSFLVPMGIGALCLAGMNLYKFGSLFETGYSDQAEGIQFATPILIGLQGLLFSIGRGLIYFSPPLVLALWAFPALWRLDRRLTITVAFLIASVLGFHAKWINWSGAWCWGPRHIFMIHIFLALTIAAWMAEAPKNSARRISLAVLFVVGLVVQIYGSSQDFVQFHHVMFRTPGEAPNFRVLYSEGEQAWHDPYYQVVQRTESGQIESIPLPWIGAPVNDSLYVPQNSCWAGYAAMWHAGYQDNLWLRLLK